MHTCVGGECCLRCLGNNCCLARQLEARSERRLCWTLLVLHGWVNMHHEMANTKFVHLQLTTFLFHLPLLFLQENVLTPKFTQQNIGLGLVA